MENYNTGSNDIQSIAQALGKARKNQQLEDSWNCLCPYHKDINPSLTLTRDGEKMLANCKAGCERVFERLVADGYIKPEARRETREPIIRVETPKHKVAEYIYTDEQGEPLYKVERLEGTNSDGKREKTFSQKRAVNGGWTYGLGETRKVLYRLPEVINAIKEGKPVYLVEGEKDVNTAYSLGLVATCVNGGANQSLPKDIISHFETAKVVILPDTDKAGVGFARRAYDDLSDRCECVIITPFPITDGIKDLTDAVEKGKDRDWVEHLPPVEDINAWAEEWLKNNKESDEELEELEDDEVLVNEHPLPKPFRGYMQTQCEAVIKSAQIEQPALTTLAVLIGMASQIPSSYQYREGLRLNLYGLGTAHTTQGKDALKRAVNKMAYSSAAGFGAEMPTTHSGLYEDIFACSKKYTKEEVEGTKIVHNFEFYPKDDDAAKKSKKPSDEQIYRYDMAGRHIVFVADEISKLLKVVLSKGAASWNTQLVKLLLEMFSNSANYDARTPSLKGYSGKHIPHPMVSIFGLAPPAPLAQCFTDDDIASGLLGRFLLVKGITGKPKRNMYPQVYECCKEQTFKALKMGEMSTWESAYGKVREEEPANCHIQLPEDIYLPIYEEMNERADMDGLDETTRAIYGRSLEKIKRISGVLACFEDRQSPTVSEEIIEWARAFVLHSDENMLFMAQKEMKSKSQNMEQAKQVLAKLKKFLSGKLPANANAAEASLHKAGKMTKRRLMRNCSLDSKTFEQHIATLSGMGLVSVSREGRAEVVRAKLG